MGKFNASQRQIIGSNCLSAIKNSGNGNRVMVYCASNEAGQLVAGTIQAAYGYKANKAENILESIVGHIGLGVLGPIGTGIGIATETWKNFSVNTGSKEKSNKLVKEINDCITEYGTGGVSGGVSGALDPSAYSGGEDSGGGSRIGKTTVYLAIGAALVVVVVAIIVKRKKK